MQNQLPSQSRMSWKWFVRSLSPAQVYKASRHSASAALAAMWLHRHVKSHIARKVVVIVGKARLADKQRRLQPGLLQCVVAFSVPVQLFTIPSLGHLTTTVILFDPPNILNILQTWTQSGCANKQNRRARTAARLAPTGRRVWDLGRLSRQGQVAR